MPRLPIGVLAKLDDARQVVLLRRETPPAPPPSARCTRPAASPLAPGAARSSDRTPARPPPTGQTPACRTSASSSGRCGLASSSRLIRTSRSVSFGVISSQYSRSALNCALAVSWLNRKWTSADPGFQLAAQLVPLQRQRQSRPLGSPRQTRCFQLAVLRGNGVVCGAVSLEVVDGEHGMQESRGRESVSRDRTRYNVSHERSDPLNAATHYSPDDSALDDLCAPPGRVGAGAWNSADAWPAEQLRLCGEAGVFEWFVEPESGRPRLERSRRAARLRQARGGVPDDDVRHHAAHGRDDADCRGRERLRPRGAAARSDCWPHVCHRRHLAPDDQPAAPVAAGPAGRYRADRTASSSTAIRRGSPGRNSRSTSSSARRSTMGGRFSSPCRPICRRANRAVAAARRPLGQPHRAGPLRAASSCRESGCLAGPVHEVMKQGLGAKTGGLQTSALAHWAWPPRRSISFASKPAASRSGRAGRSPAPPSATS